jgi:putative transposase
MANLDRPARLVCHASRSQPAWRNETRSHGCCSSKHGVVAESEIWRQTRFAVFGKIPALIAPLRHLLGWIVIALSSREDLLLENLALRQQLVALHAKRPRRRLTALHKRFWVVLRNSELDGKGISSWLHPERLLVGIGLALGCIGNGSPEPDRWAAESASKEIRALTFRMAAENPTWGAPRIHGELLKLGFNVSETTVSRWLRRVPRNPDLAKRWLTFLRNHREAIAAMDFFTVPTLTFGVL